MYSVIRFGGFSNREQLDEVGASVNSAIPHLFSGPDRVASRFSCTLSDDADWEVHCKTIEERVTALSLIIRKATLEGITMEVDIAIMQEDHAGRFYTDYPLNPSLLRILLENKIALRFTLYSGEGG